MQPPSHHDTWANEMGQLEEQLDLNHSSDPDRGFEGVAGVGQFPVPWTGIPEFYSDETTNENALRRLHRWEQNLAPLLLDPSAAFSSPFGQASRDNKGNFSNATLSIEDNLGRSPLPLWLSRTAVVDAAPNTFDSGDFPCGVDLDTNYVQVVEPQTWGAGQVYRDTVLSFGSNVYCGNQSVAANYSQLMQQMPWMSMNDPIYRPTIGIGGGMASYLPGTGWDYLGLLGGDFNMVDNSGLPGLLIPQMSTNGPNYGSIVDTTGNMASYQPVNSSGNLDLTFGFNNGNLSIAGIDAMPASSSLQISVAAEANSLTGLTSIANGNTLPPAFRSVLPPAQPVLAAPPAQVLLPLANPVMTVTSAVANTTTQAHHPIHPFRCAQTNCNKRFTRSADLLRHVRSVHSNRNGNVLHVQNPGQIQGQGQGQGSVNLCPIHGCPKAIGVGYSRPDKVAEHLWKKHGSLGYRKG